METDTLPPAESEDESEDALIHIDDAAPEKARKLIALLATARGAGASDNEVEVALAKAQRFAIKNRIDINTIVEGQTGMVAPEEEMDQAVLKVGTGKRRPPANRFICWLLQEYFDVCIVYTKLPNDPDHLARVEAEAAKGSRRWIYIEPPSAVSFLGRRSDVAFAQYAYTFLKHAFSRSWRKYKTAHDAPMSHRASFYLGVYRGLDAKLSRERRETEIQLLGGSSVSEEAYQLAVITDRDKRQAYVGEKHPILRTARNAPINVESQEATYAGMEAGESIVIHKALECTGTGKNTDPT